MCALQHSHLCTHETKPNTNWLFLYFYLLSGLLTSDPSSPKHWSLIRIRRWKTKVWISSSRSEMYSWPSWSQVAWEKSHSPVIMTVLAGSGCIGCTVTPREEWSHPRRFRPCLSQWQETQKFFRQFAPLAALGQVFSPKIFNQVK